MDTRTLAFVGVMALIVPGPAAAQEHKCACCAKAVRTTTRPRRRRRLRPPPPHASVEAPSMKPRTGSLCRCHLFGDAPPGHGCRVDDRRRREELQRARRAGGLARFEGRGIPHWRARRDHRRAVGTRIRRHDRRARNPHRGPHGRRASFRRPPALELAPKAGPEGLHYET